MDVGPRLDDELTDLESRFGELHIRYSRLCLKLRPQRSSVDIPNGTLPALYAPRFPELIKDPSELRQDRANLIADLIGLPEAPPRPHLLAERIRQEVNDALISSHTPAAAREQLYEICKRRVSALGGQCAKIVSRLGRFVRGRNSEKIRGAVNARLTMLQADLEFNEERLQRLHKGRDKTPALPVARASTCEELFVESRPYDRGTLSCIFRGDIVACLRCEMYEDQVSRLLRRFLNRMQHLPVSHRYEIWRHALLLGDAMSTVASDSHDNKPSPSSPAPRTQVERALAEVGLEFGIKACLETDDGHFFAHEVSVMFPRIFERQQRQMHFDAYPESLDAPHLRDGRLSSGVFAKYNSLCTPIGPYLQKSDWWRFVIIEARIDPKVAEQRHMMAPNSASNDYELRVARENDIRTELDLLKSADYEIVVKKLDEELHRSVSATRGPAEPSCAQLARGFAPSSVPENKEFESEIKQPPKQLLRAYQQLRFLRSRESRHSLLALLNCFRFAQQKIAHGELVAQIAVSEEHAEQWEATSKEISVRARPALPWASRPLLLSPPTLPRSVSSQTGVLPLWPREALSTFSGAERLVARAGGEMDVLDSRGLLIVHEIALNDLASIEAEMITIGGYFFGIEDCPHTTSRWGMSKSGCILADILESEVALHRAKWKLLLPYLEIYEHVAEPSAQRAVAQRILDIMACRPEFDPSSSYFAHAYVELTAALDSRADLLRRMLDHQIDIERSIAERVSDMVEDTFSRDMLGDPQLDLMGGMSRLSEGFPGGPLAGFLFEPVPGAHCGSLDILEFCPSAGLVWQVDVLVEDAAAQLAKSLSAQSTNQLDPILLKTRNKSLLQRACCSVLGDTWKLELEPCQERFLVPTCDSDIFGCEVLDDPDRLMLLIERLLEDLQPDTAREVHTTEDQAHRLSEADKVVDLRVAFMDLASVPEDDRILRLYLRLFEQVSLRRRLADTYWELQALDILLSEQARSVSVSLPELKCIPELEFFTLPKHHLVVKGAVALSAAEVDADFGRMSLSSDKLVLLHCSDFLLHKMRAAYQHELVNRWLHVVCLLHNAFVLDGPMLHLVANERAQERSAVSPHTATSDSSRLESKRLTRNSLHCSLPSALSQSPLDGYSRLIDVSKLGALCVFPATAKVPLRSSVAIVIRDRSRELKHHFAQLQSKQGRAAAYERARFSNHIKGRYLTHYSLCIADMACDLAIRVQAADAAHSTRHVVALVPAEFSSFRFSTEQTKQVLISDSGTIGSIFAVPRPIELLALRGLVEKDYVRHMLKADGDIDDLRKVDLCQLALPTLELDHRGPASIALRLLQVISGIVAHLLFWYGISGDGTVLLRHHHTVDSAACDQAASSKPLIHARNDSDRFSTASEGFEAIETGSMSSSDVSVRCPIVGVRSLAEVTWENMEMIRVDFINLAAQVKALKSDRADLVLCLLEARLRSASWRSALILRLGADAVLRSTQLLAFDSKRSIGVCTPSANASPIDHEETQVAAVAEIRCWQRKLDGRSERRGSLSRSCPEVDAPDEAVTDLNNCLVLPDASHEISPTGLSCITAVGGDPPSARSTYESPRLCRYLHPLVAAFREELAPTTPETRAFNLNEQDGRSPAITSKRGASNFSVTHDGAASLGAAASCGICLAAHTLRPFALWERQAWRFPGLPMVDISRCLCTLPPRARKLVADVSVSVEMKVDAFLAAKGYASGSLDAVQAECEMVQTMCTVAKLREVMLCLSLRRPLPSRGVECAEFDMFYETRIEEARRNENQMDLHHKHSDWERGEDTDLDSDPDIGSTAQDREDQKVTSKSMGSELKASKEELRDATDLIERMLGQVHKVLLVFIEAAYSRHITEAEQVAELAAQSDIAAMTKSVSSQSRDVAQNPLDSVGLAHSDGRRRREAPDEATKKSEMVATFNRLRTRGGRTRTFGPRGTQACIVREIDIDEVATTLGLQLLQWQRGAFDVQASTGQEQAEMAFEELRLRKERVFQLRHEASCHINEMQAQVASALLETGERQLIELDRLRRKVCTLTAAALEMEYRLGVETRKQVMENLRLFDANLQNVSSRLSQYLGDMRNSLSEEAHGLKDALIDGLEKRLGFSSVELTRQLLLIRDALFSESGAPNSGVVGQSVALVWPNKESSKDRFLAGGDAELPCGASGTFTLSQSNGSVALTRSCLEKSECLDIEALHGEINQLSWASTRLQTHYRGVFQSTRQNYEQKLQAFKTALSSNAELWDKCAIIREQGHIVEDELARTRHNVAVASETLERLVSQAVAASRDTAVLRAWRDQAYEHFSILVREQRKYEHVDKYDVKRLEQTLVSLDDKIFQHARHEFGDGIENGRAQTRIAMEYKMARIKKTHLARRSVVEDKISKKANAKAALILRELELGEAVQDESLVSLLADEYQSLVTEIDRLERVNELKRASLKVPGQAPNLASGLTPRCALKAVRTESTKAAIQKAQDGQTFEEKICFALDATRPIRHPMLKAESDRFGTRQLLPPLHEKPIQAQVARRRSEKVAHTGSDDTKFIDKALSPNQNICHDLVSALAETPRQLPSKSCGAERVTQITATSTEATVPPGERKSSAVTFARGSMRSMVPDNIVQMLSRQ